VAYLSDAIKSGQPLATRCPEAKCKETVPDSVFTQLLPENLQPMYKKFRLNDIVESSSNFMWCPAKNCNYVIQLNAFTKNEKKVKSIRCDCGNYFCFSCKDAAHRPLTCDMFGKWSLLFSSIEKMSEIWIKNNTKKCPQCSVDIEKNQGCMHMTCRKCKHEFCWICMGNWKGHQSCNAYKPNETSKSEELKQLEKFTFYRDRYEDHTKSIKQAEVKRELVMKNMETVIGLVLNIDPRVGIDGSFMKEALDLIVEARRAVTMTYVFAYYAILSTGQKDLFEYQQEILWQLLDQLDEYTDQYRESNKLFDSIVDEYGVINKHTEFKAEIVNRVCNVKKSCNSILSYIENDLQTKSEQAKLGYWSCSSCTFINPTSRTDCSMCSNENV